MNFSHQEVGSDCDALSDVNSEYMKLPLPEGIDDHVESPDYEPSIGFEESFIPPVDPFSNDDVTSFAGLLVTPVQPHLQCCLSQCLGSCQGSTWF